MAGNTPINGYPFPVGSEPPSGATQIESLARSVDTRSVPRFASVAARNSAIPNPVGGMVCYVTDLKRLQVYTSGAWFSLVDGSQSPSGQQENTLDNQAWTSTAGVETPGTSPQVQVPIVVPDSGRLFVTFSAQMKVDNGSAGNAAYIGFRVKTVSSQSPTAPQELVPFRTQMACTATSTEYNSKSWSQTVDLGAAQAGNTVYVALMHSVSGAGRTGTARSRTLTVIPTR